MINMLPIAIAVIATMVVLFIVKAVRQTKADIDKRFMGTDPSRRDDMARELAEQIRKQEVNCSRCGRYANALIGTNNKYKCHSCNFEFEGPPHIPTPTL